MNETLGLILLEEFFSIVYSYNLSRSSIFIHNIDTPYPHRFYLKSSNFFNIRL